MEERIDNNTRFRIAKSDIVAFFDNQEQKIFRKSDLAKILSAQRQFWRLAGATSVADLIRFLIEEGNLRQEQFKFPYRPETRYTWGTVPFYSLVLALKAGSYFSHYTAMYFHHLTEQVPKTIFVNCEQRPKPSPTVLPDQSRIDAAFSRPMRTTKNIVVYQDWRICLINGMHTNQLGVIDLETVEAGKARVSDMERTLIDIAVRPAYAGGVSEVLKAFRTAQPLASINKLAAMLRKLNYVYPYHQAIGFYLDRAGVYGKSQIDLIREFPVNFDFYLTYNMADTAYDDKWRLFYPKGL